MIDMPMLSCGPQPEAMYGIVDVSGVPRRFAVPSPPFSGASMVRFWPGLDLDAGTGVTDRVIDARRYRHSSTVRHAEMLASRRRLSIITYMLSKVEEDSPPAASYHQAA